MELSNLTDPGSVVGRERVLAEQSIDESDPTNEEVHDILGHYWQRGKFILSGVPEEMFQKFNERFSSPRSPGECRTGLQVSAGMANSPVKAWRLIFTTYIMKRIVNHTYKPGQKATSDDGDYDPSYKILELEKMGYIVCSTPGTQT